MSDDSNFLVDAFRRQLTDTITPAVVRSIESGGPWGGLWGDLGESGFLDALVPEAAGGAGLALSDVFPLILAAGEFAVPLPFAETMVARGLAARAGLRGPDGAMLLLAGPSNTYPGGAFAGHALVDRAGGPAIVEVTGSGGDLFATGGAMTLDHGGTALATLDGPVALAAAAVASALMAGAMARVLDMTLRYAGERQQFGRALGKFQAIQQQLAVLAEQVISAQVAARSAFEGDGFEPVRVAAAKCRTSEAATAVCNIAHAIHGAIGVTAEFDLQLYTRRIKQWQLAFGSETCWAGRLGLARIADGSATTVDFLRLNLAHKGT